MKWYSIELIDNYISKVIVYKENLPSDEMPNYKNLIDYCFIEGNSYIKGYCDCLENFGYKKWSGWNDKV